MRTRIWRRGWRVAVGALLLLLAAGVAAAQDEQPVRITRKGTVAGMTDAEFAASLPEYFHRDSHGRLQMADIPDIYGPGAVLNVGNIAMKVTNIGAIGNPYTFYSTDPSAQYPGVSGIEYLYVITLAVGAVNPTATDPNAIRRVSHFTEWRPPSLDPVDHIYKTYDGMVNGMRFVDDDHDVDPNDDPWVQRVHVDEDFLDGIDNDGDHLIDEDFGALGQQEFTCRLRDDTQQAINATYNEKHVPLGLEVQQEAWAYSIEPNTNFNVIRWTIFNKSGHMLDSMVVGGVVDMDCGPTDKSGYYSDDLDLGGYPSGTFPYQVYTYGNPDASADKFRAQDSSMRDPSKAGATWLTKFPRDSALCSHFNVSVHGFSIADDDGDLNRTFGIPSFLLIDYTVDPTGINGPTSVGFTSYRSYTSQPYSQGGYPRVDHDKYESMIGESMPGVDEYGTINAEPGQEKGDYQAWWSCGIWRNVPDGGSVQVTVAFTVGGTQSSPALYRNVQNYRLDYAAYQSMPDGPEKEARMAVLFAKYKNLANAYAAQIAYEGVYDYPEVTAWKAFLPQGHGRETPLHPKRGEPNITAADCRDGDNLRTVKWDDKDEQWFDFDCDYCTGAFDSQKQIGLIHHTWVASAPPPSPNVNVSANYNYSDNPTRVVPAGDDQILLAWDNSSETTSDPKTRVFDCRGYRIWKAANWTRPVGSAGPSDDDWSLMGEFRLFHFFSPASANPPYELVLSNQLPDSQVVNGITVPTCTDPPCWPRVFIPSWHYPKGSVQCNDPLARPAIDGGCVAPTSRYIPPPGNGELPDPLCTGAGPWPVCPPSAPSPTCVRPAPDGGCFVPDSVTIELHAGDLWNHQTGEILHPQAVECARDPLTGGCATYSGCQLGPAGRTICVPEQQTRYVVGRYQWVDHEVKNGFVYFYSVTAFDSTNDVYGKIHEQHSRRSASESDMVVPQAGTGTGKNVWVVPNPYRGFRNIADRPSSWDLTPNGSDPTGTHVDFMGLPRSKWTIRIYTVSGDLVQTIRSEDQVNESVRTPIPGPGGTVIPGYNRQQDNPNDGQARWNLISRNGQDVVSGIYLFTVESDSGTQRGKFVIIR